MALRSSSVFKKKLKVRVNVMKLGERSDAAVEIMIKYLYTSKADIHHCKGTLLVDLFTMADKSVKVR